MKKLMIVANLVVAVTMTAGAAPLDPKTCTEQEVRAALAEVLAATNDWYACGVSNKLWAVFNLPRFRDVRLEADDALAARGRHRSYWWPLLASYPKLSAQARAAVGADTAYAKSIVIAGRLGCDLYATSILSNGGTLSDVAVYLSESAAFPDGCTAYLVDGKWKTAMQKAAVKAIKKYIRSQGKSFVTKDGVNPCEAYATALTTALDAPRFAGLDAWYKSIGLAGVDLAALPSEAEVSQLRQDVLDGAKDMTGRVKVILYVCLGVDGYNQFVREYNGD